MMPDWNADPDNYAFQKRLRREPGLPPWGEAQVAPAVLVCPGPRRSRLAVVFPGEGLE